MWKYATHCVVDRCADGGLRAQRPQRQLHPVRGEPNPAENPVFLGQLFDGRDEALPSGTPLRRWNDRHLHRDRPR